MTLSHSALAFCKKKKIVKLNSKIICYSFAWFRSFHSSLEVNAIHFVHTYVVNLATNCIFGKVRGRPLHFRQNMFLKWQLTLISYILLFLCASWIKFWINMMNFGTSKLRLYILIAAGFGTYFAHRILKVFDCLTAAITYGGQTKILWKKFFAKVFFFKYAIKTMSFV